MSRAIAVIATLIFLVLAAYAFLSLRPVSLPKPLDPLAEWFDERRSGKGQSDDSATATGLSTTPAAKPVGPTTIVSRTAVAQVTVDAQGHEKIEPAFKNEDKADTGTLSVRQPAVDAAAVREPATESAGEGKVTGRATASNESGQTRSATGADNTVTKRNATESVVMARIDRRSDRADNKASAVTQRTDGLVSVVGQKSPSDSPEPRTRVLSRIEEESTSSTDTKSLPAVAPRSTVAADATVRAQQLKPVEGAVAEQVAAVSTAAGVATDTLAARAARATQRANAQVVAHNKSGKAPANLSTESGSTNGTRRMNESGRPGQPLQVGAESRPVLQSRDGSARSPEQAAPAMSVGRPSGAQGSARANEPMLVANALAPLAPSAKPQKTMPREVVALIPPEAAAPPPRTPEALRQQRSIVNYLDGRVVEFQVGRDALTEVGTGVLDRLVPLIKANKGTVITIQGHTDDVGDDRSNLDLSGSRAIAARRYLIRKGISPKRLKVQGLGERFPLADNNTESGRIRNRRIDFAVSDAG